MGNLTTHGWLTALHHQLIDRASVSFFYWPNQNGVEPTWPLRSQALSPLLLSHVLIFSLPHSLNVLVDMRAAAWCEFTPVGWPIRDWISQPHHCHFLLPSQFHSYTFCCTTFSGSGSSWLRLMYRLCGLNGSFCFGVLNSLLYFNLGSRQVSLVALWVHFKKMYLLTVFIF